LVVVTGTPASSDDQRVARIGLVNGEVSVDVFELVDNADPIIAVRSPFLFEIGEELQIRIESSGSSRDATVRVRAHRADGVTELELV
jgi:hypothetical protein